MEQHIHHIIVKHLSAEATQVEEQKLKLWLAESEEHRQIYDDHVRLWNNLDNAFDQTKFDAERAWKAMEDRIQVKPTRTKIFIPNYLKYISAAAVVLLSLFIWSPWQAKEQVIIAQQELEQVWLPDSTLVTLRNGSSLSYNADYNKLDRSVHLQGEAFFEVTKNPNKRFIVHTSNANIQVLGTSFDVLTDNVDYTSVSVATGKVEVNTLDGQQKVALLPNEQSIVNDKTIEVISDETANNQNFWRSKSIQFNNKPLQKVVEDLSKYTRQTIQIQSKDNRYLQQEIRVQFNNMTMEQMLDDLCLITNSSWSKQNELYILRTK